MHLISIIVPVFNVEDYIRRCLDSIINQTYKNLEIILVDDGSTDNSGKICDEYAKNDSRIKVVHKFNGGLSDARNVGLATCTGDYIGFVDSDDYIALDMYATLYKFQVSNDLDVSMCETIEVYEDDDRCVYGTKFESKNYNKKEDIIIELFNNKYGGSSIIVCNKLFKRDVLENIRFDVGITYEDVFFFSKWLFNTEKFGRICEYKYFYFRRKGSITIQNKFNESFLDVIAGYEKNLDLIRRFYPTVIECANNRLCWAYKIVIERIYCCNDYKFHKLLVHNLQNKIRKELFNILVSNLLSYKAKVMYLLISINIDLYMYIREVYRNRNSCKLEG